MATAAVSCLSPMLFSPQSSAGADEQPVRPGRDAAGDKVSFHTVASHVAYQMTRPPLAMMQDQTVAIAVGREDAHDGPC